MVELDLATSWAEFCQHDQYYDTTLIRQTDLLFYFEIWNLHQISMSTKVG